MAARPFKKWIGLGLYLAGCFVVGLFPHHGPPHFRYTGSDPDVAVWNIGWPVATMIWDPRTGLEVGPFAYILFPLMILIGFVAVAAIAIEQWLRANHRLQLTGDARDG